MNKKSFSLILGVIFGIILFSIIFKIANNEDKNIKMNLDKSEMVDIASNTGTRRDLGSRGGLNSGENFGDSGSTEGMGMGMRGNLTETLGMTQEDIDKELENGKTIKELMDEKGINIENMPRPRIIEEDENIILKTGAAYDITGEKINDDILKDE